MGTDREQHMCMLDEALCKGKVGRERKDIIKMMNALRSKIVLEACKKDAKRMEVIQHIWEYHQRMQEKTGLLHDRIGDMLQIAEKEEWNEWKFIMEHEGY